LWTGGRGTHDGDPDGTIGLLASRFTPNPSKGQPQGRREMIRSIARTIGAALLACGLAGPALAQSATSLKLALVGRQAAPDGAGAQAFADAVKELTGGRYAVEVSYGGALGGERDILEGVQLGTVDLALTSTSITGNFVPDFQMFDIPFLFRDFGHAQRVLDGPIGQDVLGKLTGRGLVGLGLGGVGFRQLTNSRKPVDSAEGVRGMKIRTMENPIHLQAWRAIGALPTPMALPEVFPALQQGTVDGQENPIGAIIGNRFGEVQKHLSMTNHAFTATVITASPRVWAKLAEADKAAFREAAKRAALAQRQRTEEIEREGLDKLRGMGVQVVERVDHARFQAELTGAYADYAKRFGDERLNQIRNTQ